MRQIVSFLCIVTCLSGAQAATIELRNPAYPLASCLTLGADEPASFWVVLQPEGATDITGARFSISGLPDGCSTNVVPAENTSWSGDLFSPAGAQILFSAAQSSAVRLFEVTLTCPASSLQEYVTLRPDAFESDIPNPGCPSVIVEGRPGEYECVGYTSISNHPLACEIGVDNSSWSTIKQLFR